MLQAGSERPQTNSATRALTRGKKRSLVRAMSNLSVNSDDELPKPLRTPSTSGDDGGNDDDGAGGAASSSSDARLLTFITGMELGSQHVRPLFLFVRSVSFNCGPDKPPDGDMTNEGSDDL